MTVAKPSSNRSYHRGGRQPDGSLIAALSATPIDRRHIRDRLLSDATAFAPLIEESLRGGSPVGTVTRRLFGVGAVTASAVWFVSLGLGARRLVGLFATPLTWRILDGVIAVTMIALGASLVVS